MRVKQEQGANPLLFKFLGMNPSKGDMRKMEIIEATVNCLATQGMDSTSLESVAKASKIARSHIIYYFKNKEELFDAAFKYVLANAQDVFVQKMEKNTSPLELLKAYVDVLFEWVEAYESHAKVMLLFYHCSSSMETYKKIHTEIRAAARNRIKIILEGLAEKKKKLSPSQLENYSQAIHCMLTGFALEHLTTSSKLSLNRTKERAYGVVKEMLEL